MSGYYRGQRSSQRSRSRGQRNYRGRSRRNNSSTTIPRHMYISQAEENYVAPSVYVTDATYDQFDLHHKLKENIRYKGYKNPTQIQHEAIPVIMQNRDIIGLASTGTGKTGAFLIPTINKVIKSNSERVLIIVPTRELAVQIQNEFMDFSRGLNLYSTVIIGGKSIRHQTDKLRRNPQFVIGTPGRLKDLYERRNLNLAHFNNIILDEVDRMLDMGFIGDVSHLISQLKEQRQSMFFSATINKEAENIANTLLSDPVRIQSQKEEAHRNVHQDVVDVPQSQKIDALVKILNDGSAEKVLIFSRTKRGADKLASKLSNYSNLQASAIHGGKPQNKRQRILDEYRSNKFNILVATDVAARGLDIPNVSHVINYDEPENYKDYIHRIGRTGRAGKTGIALTFVSR